MMKKSKKVTYLAFGHIRISADKLLGAPLHVVRDGEVHPHQEHLKPQQTQPLEMPGPKLPNDAENVLVQVVHYRELLICKK